MYTVENRFHAFQLKTVLHTISIHSSCTDGGDNTLRCKTEANELTEERLIAVAFTRFSMLTGHICESCARVYISIVKQSMTLFLSFHCV